MDQVDLTVWDLRKSEKIQRQLMSKLMDNQSLETLESEQFSKYFSLASSCFV